MGSSFMTGGMVASKEKAGLEKSASLETKNLNPNRNIMKIQTSLLPFLIGVGTTTTTSAQQPDRRPAGIPRSMERREHHPTPPRQSEPSQEEQTMLDFPLETRTIDGAGNNLANPVCGMAETATLRLASIAYEDETEVPDGEVIVRETNPCEPILIEHDRH